MSKICKAFGLMVLAAAMAGCVSHGPGGIAYSTGASESVGTTSAVGGGSLSGSGTSDPKGDKDVRGNTPPGMDRDGHGPAAGAIVDPTGAARGKPY